MKITLIRKDEEQGTEALSLCDTDAFFEKVKTENKAGHISELREILPRLAGSSARYVHIDKLPRVYPAVEYTRKQKGEKRMKHYNGLVQLEVNRPADLYEVEYVKRQVEQLPQTFAYSAKHPECFSEYEVGCRLCEEHLDTIHDRGGSAD